MTKKKTFIIVIIIALIITAGSLLVLRKNTPVTIETLSIGTNANSNDQNE